MANNFTVRTVLAIFLLAISGLPLLCRGDTLTTGEIISRSYSEMCLEWKISGMCIWLKCSLFGCRIVTTPRISHRLPDFVVAAYPQTGHSPWPAGIRQVIEEKTQITEVFSGGGITGVGATRLLHDELKFNEVDVIGGPVAQQSGVQRFLCRSLSQPLFPYFISLHDALEWRNGLAESKRREALHPGLREIGSWPDFSWGSVFPRTGFVIQAHAGKAAAVASQRAIDIVLRDNTAHVTGKQTLPMSGQFSRGDVTAMSAQDCSRSGGRWQQTSKLNNSGQCMQQVWHQWLGSGNEKTDRWQMLLPHSTNRCETFGEQPEWPHPQVSRSGQYLWNYWVQYKCCVKAGGILLKHFDF